MAIGAENGAPVDNARNEQEGFIDAGTQSTLIGWLLGENLNRQKEAALQIHGFCKEVPTDFCQSGLLATVFQRLSQKGRATEEPSPAQEKESSAEGEGPAEATPEEGESLETNKNCPKPSPENERLDAEVVEVLCKGITLVALNKDLRRAVRNEGGLKTLVALLARGPDDVVTSAAVQAITILAIDDVNKEALREVEAIEPLIALLDSGAAHPITAHVLGCLANLHASHPGNQQAMVDRGIVGKLEKFDLNSASPTTVYRAQTLLMSFYSLVTPMGENDDSPSILQLMLKEAGHEKSQALQWLSQWLHSQDSDDKFVKAALVSAATVRLAHRVEKSKSKGRKKVQLRVEG